MPKALAWLAGPRGEVAQESGAGEGASGRLLLRARRFGERLLGLPGWIIEGAAVGPDGHHVRARYAPEPDRCPRCGAGRWAAWAIHRHGSKQQRLRD